MPGRKHNGSEQTVPVEPTVHVETFATHCTLTWRAGPLAGLLTAVDAVDSVPPAAPVVVDDTSSAGRERCRVPEVDPQETVRYLGVREPVDPLLGTADLAGCLAEWHPTAGPVSSPAPADDRL